VVRGAGFASAAAAPALPSSFEEGGWYVCWVRVAEAGAQCDVVEDDEEDDGAYCGEGGLEGKHRLVVRLQNTVGRKRLTITTGCTLLSLFGGLYFHVSTRRSQIWAP
jgi:hypothetical protein